MAALVAQDQPSRRQPTLVQDQLADLAMHLLDVAHGDLALLALAERRVASGVERPRGAALKLAFAMGPDYRGSATTLNVARLPVRWAEVVSPRQAGVGLGPRQLVDGDPLPAGRTELDARPVREAEALAGVEPAPVEVGDGRVQVRHTEHEHRSVALEVLREHDARAPFAQPNLRHPRPEGLDREDDLGVQDVDVEGEVARHVPARHVEEVELLEGDAGHRPRVGATARPAPRAPAFRARRSGSGVRALLVARAATVTAVARSVRRPGCTDDRARACTRAQPDRDLAAPEEEWAGRAALRPRRRALRQERAIRDPDRRQIERRAEVQRKPGAAWMVAAARDSRSGPRAAAAPAPRPRAAPGDRARRPTPPRPARPPSRAARACRALSAAAAQPGSPARPRPRPPRSKHTTQPAICGLSGEAQGGGRRAASWTSSSTSSNSSGATFGSTASKHSRSRSALWDLGRGPAAIRHRRVPGVSSRG